MKQLLKFKSEIKQNLIDKGRIIDNKARDFIKEAIGSKKKLVEAKKHTIISGPPGVG
jgi:hypothetical protein